MSSAVPNLPIEMEVPEFLERFQGALKLSYPPPIWHEAQRRLVEWADLEVNPNDVLDHLQCLTADHHHAGPEPDDHEPNLAIVHKFRYPLEDGTEVYVKIGLKKHAKKKGMLIPKIWSFKRWDT